MQKTNLARRVAAIAASLACLSGTFAIAQTGISPQAQAASKPAPQTPDSIQTVEALLNAENKAANDKLRSLAEASAPPKTPALMAPKLLKRAGPASVQVGGIYGVEGKLRAHITYDGQTLPARQVGERVGPCEIVAIQGSCVTLRKFVIDTSPSLPAGAGLADGEQVLKKGKALHARKGASKLDAEPVSSALMCPSACWTAPAAAGPSFTSYGAGLQSPPGSFPAAGASRYPVPSLLPSPMSAPAAAPTPTPSVGAASTPSLRAMQTPAPFGQPDASADTAR